MMSIPQLPRMIYGRLAGARERVKDAQDDLANLRRRLRHWLQVVAVLLAVLIVILLLRPL
jgi:phage tail protein X